MDTHKILTFIDTCNGSGRKKNTQILFLFKIFCATSAYIPPIRKHTTGCFFFVYLNTVCTTVKVESIEYKL